MTTYFVDEHEAKRYVLIMETGDAAMTLIPTNGVHISESYFPKGFYVARSDHEGFTRAPRWFPTKDAAEAYARKLAAH